MSSTVLIDQHFAVLTSFLKMKNTTRAMSQLFQQQCTIGGWMLFHTEKIGADTAYSKTLMPIFDRAKFSSKIKR